MDAFLALVLARLAIEDFLNDCAVVSLPCSLFVRRLYSAAWETALVPDRNSNPCLARDFDFGRDGGHPWLCRKDYHDHGPQAWDGKLFMYSE